MAMGPNIYFEPVDVPASLRLEKGMKIVRSTLEELYPGPWRTEFAGDHGLLYMLNDAVIAERYGA
jgi:hypothetical protein